MTYRQAFDRLGNPVARRVRFVWLRRIAESIDADGVAIVVGTITAVAIVGMWMSGVYL
jgi:ribosomal protein L18E